MSDEEILVAYFWWKTTMVRQQTLQDWGYES